MERKTAPAPCSGLRCPVCGLPLALPRDRCPRCRAVLRPVACGVSCCQGCGKG